MKKNFIIHSTLIVLFIGFTGTIFSLGGGGDDCRQAATFRYGLNPIPLVPNWSNQSCSFEAGHDFFKFTIFDVQMVDLQQLITHTYGNAIPTNPWKWWIETGHYDILSYEEWYTENSKYYCIDDDTWQSHLSLGRCVQSNTLVGACNLTVWFQVVGECDNCINNTVGGTWYFGTTTLQPMYSGSDCANPSASTQRIDLLEQNRTNCNDMSKPWGCGPGEFQN